MILRSGQHIDDIATRQHEILLSGNGGALGMLDGLTPAAMVVVNGSVVPEDSLERID